MTKASVKFSRQRGFAQKSNPTHGSGWMVQIRSTEVSQRNLRIPEVGVWFRSNLFDVAALFRRSDLNNPPTSVGGITGLRYGCQIQCCCFND